MPSPLRPALAVLLAFHFGLASLPAQTPPSAPITVPTPPPMPKRAIAPTPTPPPGTTIVLTDRGTNFTLFLPESAAKNSSTNTRITAHFHTVPWFAIQEHLRRGLREPLLIFALGEGSTAYRVPFEDRERFARTLQLTEAELVKQGAPREAKITSVDVTSFSAGYGAVRELLQTPQYFALLRRLILCDSIYGGLAPTTAGQRRVTPEHVAAWVPFAQAAARGEKTFVLTHSAIATARYASSGEVAIALLETLGIPRVPVAPGAIPAAADRDFPLCFRADRAGLHVWSYAGDDAPAHLTHIRHLADVWLALDAAEARQ